MVLFKDLKVGDILKYDHSGNREHFLEFELLLEKGCFSNGNQKIKVFRFVSGKIHIFNLSNLKHLYHHSNISEISKGYNL